MYAHAHDLRGSVAIVLQRGASACSRCLRALCHLQFVGSTQALQGSFFDQQAQAPTLLR